MAVGSATHIQWLRVLTPLVRPITARLNRDVLDHLARQLESTLTLPAAILDHNPDETANVLQSSLFRFLAQVHTEGVRLRDEVAELRDLYYRTPQGEDREQILRRTVEQRNPVWLDRFKDYRALQRHFDWEAMEERLAFELWRLWMRQLVVLEVLEGLYGGFETPPHALSPPVAAERFDSATERLLGLLDDSSYPLVRRQAARTLYALWGKDHTRAPIQFEAYSGRIMARIDDPGEDRWTRTALVDLLGRCFHDTAIEKLLRLIMDRNETGDQFLLRAHAVSTYAAWCEDVRQLRAGFIHLAGDSDTGQYVRLALVEATKIVRAENVTEFILELAEAENSRHDSSEGVRARYAESISRRLMLAMHDDHTRLQAARYLTLWATEDASPVVRRIAQEEAEALLPRLAKQGLNETAAVIVQGLTRRLSLETAPGEAERIAGVLEAARIGCALHLDALRTELQSVLVDMQWGEIRRIPVTDDVDPVDVMRILANISRRDIGIYVRFEPGFLRLMRGERFGKSLWRLLHETRHPKPRKRPDISHTRARFFHFEYRAHPEILAEINPTDVPGERQFVEKEGGWARYLPSVDDLLHARSQTVYLFSSFGVTTLRLHKRHFWLYPKLVWSYADINRLRYHALRQDEPLRQGQYVTYLKEKLGFECEFTPHQFELFGVPILLQSARVLGYFTGEAFP